MKPLVTFIVPCYKYAHLLSQCVEAILSQTFEDYEILIMDNCSPDNTPEIAQSFQDVRVKHIRNETNIGHIRNFNKGITMARGKYVWVMAADDRLRSREALRRYVDLMERDPQIGYAFCRSIESGLATEGGIVSWTDCGGEDQVWEGWDFLARLVRSNCIAMSSVMARKECYEKISLFPVELPYAADWHQWCVFAFRYRVAYFAEPMVFFRDHEESITSSFRRQDTGILLDDEINLLRRVRQEAEASGMDELVANCRGFIAARCVALGDIQYWNLRPRQALQSYWLGIKLQPWSPKSWIKYVLTRMGNIGLNIRQLLSSNSAGL